MDSYDSLIDAASRHLQTELGDAAIGRQLAETLWDVGMTWTAPAVAPEQISAIMAFTFGNRMLPNGNRSPGPVNQRLADIAVRLHAMSGARVFAQWEVAEAIGSQIPAAAVVAINPGHDERAEPVYLSTSGVIAEIARQVDPGSLGQVGIVAFGDHLFRCVTTACAFGFEAAAPAGFIMPRDYDAQSGQPWCRSRMAYLLHDIMIRVTERRAAVLANLLG